MVGILLFFEQTRKLDFRKKNPKVSKMIRKSTKFFIKMKTLAIFDGFKKILAQKKKKIKLNWPMAIVSNGLSQLSSKKQWITVI